MPSHPVDVHVGRRLRLRRTILGMSQEALGDASGVTFQQIQKYERGINRIGSSRLFQFSKILKIPVSYFFDEFDGDSSPSAIANYQAGGFAEGTGGDEAGFERMTSRETLEMARAFNKIEDAAVRKRVFELVKALVPGRNQPE